jgi:hypothetical protein
MRIGIPGATNNQYSYLRPAEVVIRPRWLGPVGLLALSPDSETVAALTPPPIAHLVARRARLSDDAQMVLLFDRYGQQTVLRFMREIGR